jgi:N-acetyl-1-D-myo-inositol-2-amino-2-deoxy-alpha-D-glucopyranoside deacetylase
MGTLAKMIGSQKALYSVPDEQVGLSVDVTTWLDKKIDAILAHRSEVQRGALPGLVDRLPPNARADLLSTEWYICWELPLTGAAGLERLTTRDG